MDCNLSQFIRCAGYRFGSFACFAWTAHLAILHRVKVFHIDHPHIAEFSCFQPTGLLTTTTRLSLHPENETRMLSLNIADTQGKRAIYFWPSLIQKAAKSPISIDGTHYRNGLRMLITMS